MAFNKETLEKIFESCSKNYDEQNKAQKISSVLEAMMLSIEAACTETAKASGGSKDIALTHISEANENELSNTYATSAHILRTPACRKDSRQPTDKIGQFFIFAATEKAHAMPYIAIFTSKAVYEGGEVIKNISYSMKDLPLSFFPSNASYNALKELETWCYEQVGIKDKNVNVAIEAIPGLMQAYFPEASTPFIGHA